MTDQPNFRLTPREELAWILAKYDSGALPPVVSALVISLQKQIEMENRR